MTLPFLLISMVTLAGALAAVALRRPVHCALALTVALVGLAALYIALGAAFVGLAQVLIYIGAVAILIVFAILLTRTAAIDGEAMLSSSWLAGAGVMLSVLGVLLWAIGHSRLRRPAAAAALPAASIHGIGAALAGAYTLPLELLALMLTAALIGAVVLALQEPNGNGKDPLA